MRRTAYVAFALFLTACSNVDSGSQSNAIVGGAETEGYPATVALMASDHAFRGQVFCTGTLIARRAVLSAAHCMDPTFVMFGTNPELSSARFVPVSSFIRHDLYAEGDLAGIEHDVAIAILGEDAPGDVAPVEIAFDAPALDQDVTWVGFGHTGYEADDKGVKRAVAFPVIGNLGNLLATANASCRADSGGSIFVEEGGSLLLVGSDRGSASMCTGDSYFVPTSVNAAWMMTTIDEHGGGGTAVVDAGAPVVDASNPGDDAGSSREDSGTPALDAGSEAEDAAPSVPSARHRSSGCSVAHTTTESSWMLWLALFGLLAVRARTRSRRLE